MGQHRVSVDIFFFLSLVAVITLAILVFLARPPFGKGFLALVIAVSIVLAAIVEWFTLVVWETLMFRVHRRRADARLAKRVSQMEN